MIKKIDERQHQIIESYKDIVERSNEYSNSINQT